jgi:oligopeptide transport system ATP-binding protein
VVNDVSFCVQQGETLGIVGESGSGKSMTALAVAGLLPYEAQVKGDANFWGERLHFAHNRRWHTLRGKQIGIVFQDPAGCLNPLIPAGEQVSEVLRQHKQLDASTAIEETRLLFDSLGLHPPLLRMRQYPHQLSGGMKQRVMLAAAICCRPRLLIADEPTTALDVSVQAQILQILKSYTAKTGTALMLISHDLGVIAQLTDRVLVMCGGIVVEEGPVIALFETPLHPYTRWLLECIPRLDRKLTLSVPPDEKNTSGLCVFSSRCQKRGPLCNKEVPPIHKESEHRAVRCHYRW